MALGLLLVFAVKNESCQFKGEQSHLMSQALGVLHHVTVAMSLAERGGLLLNNYIV